METIGTIEVVIFSLKQGVNDVEGKKALETLSECVQGYPGFIGRKLGKNEAGRWMDLVYWTDHQSALSAAEQVMQNPDALKVFELIDEETMIMYHFDIESEFTPELILNQS